MAVLLMSPMQPWNSRQLCPETETCYPPYRCGFYTGSDGVEEPAHVATSMPSVENGECSSRDDTTTEETPEQREKVMKQVEWYFGDENLLKDSFLMKHINRNKQGYVSLKLVASLRKVKAITKDWTVVQESIRGSELLELNEDGTKIRRLAPAPEVDYSRLPKTIIITNYHSEEPNADEVEEEFSQHGEVAGVQILYPGKAIPLDVKSCRAQHPAIGKEVCVLVEYSSGASARRACSKNSSSENWRQTMEVKLLVEPEDSQEKAVKEERPNKKDNGKKQKNEKADKAKPSKSKRGGAERDGQQKSVTKHSSTPQRRLNGRHQSSLADYNSDSGYSCRSASNSPMPSPKLTRRLHSEHQHMAPPASRQAAETGRPMSHIQRLTKDVSVVVIRQPSGPDGSRGFHKRN